MSSHRRAAALATVLAGVLALPTLAAAREAHPARPTVQTKAQTRAALAASEGFTARMSRLDALMGGARTAGPRARSANAAAD